MKILSVKMKILLISYHAIRVDDISNRITTNSPHVDVFNFSTVTVKDVHNLLENMDKKKATGYDDIPPKILKVSPCVRLSAP